MRALNWGRAFGRLVMVAVAIGICLIAPPAAGATAVPPNDVVLSELLEAAAGELAPAPVAELGFTALDPSAVVAPADGVSISQTDQESGGIPGSWWGSLGLLAFGMASLTKDRDTIKRDGKIITYPVAAAKKIYAGALVVLNAGYAEPGATALNLIAVGRANGQVDNSAGAAGDLEVQVESGVFLFANDGTVVQADVGKTAYIVDDQTVSDLDRAGAEAAATRSPAGTIRGVEAGGVWVEI